MYRILSASKDTYITNRIITNNFRATDANVGKASTLDLFKLYDESVSGSLPATENSRILVKFDLSKARDMHTRGLIDISDSSFQVKLHLKDVYGGQTTPNNFKLIVFPLAQNFEEGIGRDVVRYSDIDVANYVTASFTNSQAILWNRPGAMKSGSLGDSNIDVIVSGNLSIPGSGVTRVNLSREQLFNTGEEDLEVDVTPIISGTITSQIDDHGFLVAFSGSYEKDNYTYFVKRFGSNQSLRQDLRPHLSLRYNDSILDNSQNFIFDVTGSLFLNNYHRGTLSNILSGSGASEVKGHNCLKLKISSGSFVKYVTGSQYSVGGLFKPGIYSASFAIDSYSSPTFEFLKNSLSASYNIEWVSGTDLFPDDGSTVTYLKSSVTIQKPSRTTFNNSQKRLLVVIKNLKERYTTSQVSRVRVFIEDRDRPITYTKTPFETMSQIFNNMHYRIVDSQTGEVIIPFDIIKNSTRLSSDTDGMYFNLYMDGLLVGRSYKIQFLIKDFEDDIFVDELSSSFTVQN